MWRLPEVLIIHLKRFRVTNVRTTKGYMGGSGYTWASTEKMMTIVDFPEVLDMVRSHSSRSNISLLWRLAAPVHSPNSIARAPPLPPVASCCPARTRELTYCSGTPMASAGAVAVHTGQHGGGGGGGGGGRWPRFDS